MQSRVVKDQLLDHVGHGAMLALDGRAKRFPQGQIGAKRQRGGLARDRALPRMWRLRYEYTATYSIIRWCPMALITHPAKEA